MVEVCHTMVNGHHGASLGVNVGFHRVKEVYMTTAVLCGIIGTNHSIGGAIFLGPSVGECWFNIDADLG